MDTTEPQKSIHDSPEGDRGALRRQVTAIQQNPATSAAVKSKQLFDLLNPGYAERVASERTERAPAYDGEVRLRQPYQDKLKCTHYQRNVWVHAPGRKTLPGAYIECRFCHELDRFEVRYMKCKACLVSQKAAASCANPDCYWLKKPHRFYCDTCHLWENDAAKAVFHCDKCGICRLGDASKYIHCERCELCVLKDSRHQCRSSAKDSACPVCFRPLHDSTDWVSFGGGCGHAMHGKCRKALLETDYRCPVCRMSLEDMSSYWSLLDRLALSSPSRVPEEYRHWKSAVLCNDCCAKNVVPFSVDEYRCPGCGGWNTAVENVIRE
ncbi:unnamed protein product [Phaeothamnion confervicola]